MEDSGGGLLRKNEDMPSETQLNDPSVSHHGLGVPVECVSYSARAAFFEVVDLVHMAKASGLKLEL